MAANTEFLADGPVGDDRPAPESPSAQTIALKLGLFLALFFAAFCVLYYVSERVRPVYPTTYDRAQLVETSGGEITGLTLGQSHAVSAITFDSLNVRGLHLAQAGFDQFQAAYTMETVRDKLPNLRVVFVVAPYIYGENHLIGDIGWDRRRETYLFGARLRGPLYFNKIDEDSWDWKQLLQSRVWPVARPGDNWYSVLLRLRYPHLDPYRATSDGRDRPPWKPRTPEKLIEESRKFSEIHLENRDLLYEARPDICETGAEAYERLVRAAGPDVAVVFFTNPYHDEYREPFKEMDRTSDVYPECTPAYAASQIEKEYDNVIYVDLADYEPITSDPAAHFNDGAHLALPGANVFSARLRDILAERFPEELPSNHPSRDLYAPGNAISLAQPR